jgi:hypothetical protein
MGDDVSAPLRILLVTDSFPPCCGGSGWSTFELARGLVARGHHVEVVKVDTKQDTTVVETTVEGLPVTEYRQPRRRHSVRAQHSEERAPVVRTREVPAQAHCRSQLRSRARPARHDDGAVDQAGRDAGIPSVATVRDYWPICYGAI